MPIPAIASVAARGFTSVVGRTAAQGGGTAARATVGGAASKGTGVTTGTVAGYMLGGGSGGSGGSGGTGSQVKQSTILDAKGKPIVSSARGGGGSSIEQMREQDATQNRMLQLLETIAENTGGKATGVAKDKPQQTMFESLGASLGSFSGSLMAIVGGLGIFQGFKDAKAAYDNGESMFTVFAEGIKGTTKTLLNIPFNIVDNILNTFTDFDIPDNMGTLIVDGFVKVVNDFVDYVKNLPDRIMKAITGMIENIGIPEIKILGKSFGPYYPFRGSGEVKQENTQGAESGAAFASASPTENNNKKFTMPQPSNKEGITNDLNQTAPVGDVTSSNALGIKGLPSVSSITRGTTSYIKDPVTGEGMTIKKSATSLTEKQAMDILTNKKFAARISQINLEIKGAFENGSPPPKIEDLPFMDQKDLYGDGSEEYFRKAMYTVYPKLIADLYASETKDGENASSLFKELSNPLSERSIKDGKSIDTRALQKELSAPIFSEIEAKARNTMRPNGRPSKLAPPSSGDAIMSGSAAVEDAKSKESGNVVISAPSSTVNAPKSSNMVMPDNIRNNEPSMSRYVDGLYGTNI